MKSGIASALVLALTLGCARTTVEFTGVTRGEANNAPDTAAEEMQPVATRPPDAPLGVEERIVHELAQLPHLDASQSKRPAPNCQTPTSVGFSAPAGGARAVRLVWDQETGDCTLEDTDRSPEGMAGILTLRVKDERVAVSAVGQWKFYVPPDIDPANVPANEALTIYPYLGEWQFVATIEHNTQLVKLLEFAYLRGEGDAAGGVRKDLEDHAPSEYVRPTLCAPQPEAGESP